VNKKEKSKFKMKVRMALSAIIFIILLNTSQGLFRTNGHSDFKLQRREGFFLDLDDPLSSLRSGFQGMASNFGRSMKSLMTSISSGMQSLGAGFRRPKLLPIQSMFNSYRPKEPEHNVHTSVPAAQYKPVAFQYPPLEPINTPIVGHYVQPSQSQHTVNFPALHYVSQSVAAPEVTVHQTYPAPEAPVQQNYPAPVQQIYPIVPQEDTYVPAEPVYNQPETSYSVANPVQISPQPVPVQNIVQPAQAVDNDDYGAPNGGSFAPLNSYYTAPQINGDNSIEPVVVVTPTSDDTQIILPQSEYTFNPQGNHGSVASNSISSNSVQHLQGSSQGIIPLTVAPDNYRISTTTLESYHHLTEAEICEHLKSLKEDVHKAGLSHAGHGGSPNVDPHKFVEVGVHVNVQKPSAVVPDQSHPEKYINLECDKIKEVVEHNLWYKDTKPYLHKLHGHNRVRDDFHHNANL